MDENNREQIIHAVKSPLGFYTLTLFIIETFIGTVLIFSDLDEGHKFCGMIIGVVLFLIVIVIVSLLVWFKPKNFVYTEESHVKSESLEKLPGETYKVVTLKNKKKDEQS